jgi:hypothetical protein
MSFLLLLISTLQWNWRKAQNKFCLEGREWGRGWVAGAGGRNDPNNVCTFELMNNKKKIEFLSSKSLFQYFVVIIFCCFTVEEKQILNCQRSYS